MRPVSDVVVGVYEPLYSHNITDFDALGRFSPLPKFSAQSLSELCNTAQKIFEKENTVLRISGDVVIVGDIHGNIKDLLRILSAVGNPSKTQYLFLGDYVDRGEFSLEVITLLFALKCKYPNTIYLIRGNHEIDSVNALYGFKDQILKDYNQSLWEEFNRVFDYLPLAAIISNTTIAIHGGISPLLNDINEIERIQRPVLGDLMSSLVNDILWSDPYNEINGFVQSQRGKGVFFGPDALRDFLQNNNLRRLVRGHQCVFKGVAVNTDKNLITVFSASNYMGNSSNYSGIVALTSNDMLCPFNYPPLRQLNRNETRFREYLTSSDRNTPVAPQQLTQRKIFKIRMASPKPVISGKMEKSNLPKLEPYHSRTEMFV